MAWPSDPQRRSPILAKSCFYCVCSSPLGQYRLSQAQSVFSLSLNGSRPLSVSWELDEQGICSPFPSQGSVLRSKPYRAWRRQTPKGLSWAAELPLLTGSLFPFLLLWARVTCHPIHWAWKLGRHLRVVRLRRPAASSQVTWAGHFPVPVSAAPPPLENMLRQSPRGTGAPSQSHQHSKMLHFPLCGSQLGVVLQ